MKSAEDFTFVSVILLVMPIFLDDYISISKAFKITWLRIINTIISFIDFLIICFCLCGMFGLFSDNGDSFSIVESALLGIDFTVQKSFLSWLLILNLFETIMMWVVIAKGGESAIYSAFNEVKQEKQGA